MVAGRRKGGYARAMKRQKEARWRLHVPDQQICAPALQYYVNRIQSGLPYTFVRYGDGEWVAGITHCRNSTSSKSQRLDIPSLQAEMRCSLMHCHVADNYIVGLRPSSLTTKETRGVKEWLQRNVSKKTHWHDSRVFYRSSKYGQLLPLVKVLQNLNIPLIFVGPARLKILREKGVFPKAQYIIIPERNCYQHKLRIMQNVLDAPRPAFISFSAGPAAKVMIYQLFPVLGSTSFLFDFGSLWDVYVGSCTRTYHRTMSRATINKNLGIG